MVYIHGALVIQWAVRVCSDAALKSSRAKEAAVDDYGIIRRDQKVETVFIGLRGSGPDTADISFGLHGVKNAWLHSGLMWQQVCCCCPSPQMRVRGCNFLSAGCDNVIFVIATVPDTSFLAR